MSQLVNRCDFQIGDQIDYRYTVNKILGEGSFGKVYLVTDLNGQRHALKILRLWEVTPEIRKELESRFDLEFKTGQIACENLVQSEEYGNIGGNPYIVMEFCSGGDMTPLLGNAQGREAVICRHILNGLRALHTNGKVHRDLKPENVLFKDGGIAALTDFGIAGDRNHRMTSRNIFGRPDQMFGTFAYMAPEQFNRARGNATVLPTTDIYSFGVLAFQLLTGEYPFGKLESHNDLAEYQKRSKENVWNRHLLQHLPDNQAWFTVIERCIEPDFHKRLQSASDVMALLPTPPQQPAYVLQAPQQQHNRPQQPYAQPAWQSVQPVQSRQQVQPRQPVQPERPAPRQPVQRQPVPTRYAATPQPQRQQPTSAEGTCLRVMQGDEHGRTYDLNRIIATSRRHVITIGREKDNNVYVLCEHSYYVSRHHCTIEHNPTNERWTLRDGQWATAQRQWLASANGTYVNSKEAGQEGVSLHDGDIITMGDVTLRFEKN